MTQMRLLVQESRLSSHLHWDIDWTIESGRAHWLQGPNGIGKTSLFDEIKCQWPALHPQLQLGFTDQAPLDTYQDLTVAAVFDLLWSIAADRRTVDDWRELPTWDADARALWPRKVNLLSGGENQWIKLMMMRGLRSDIWLLDEPFQSLDQRRHTELLRWMDDWTAQGNFLIIVHHGELTPERAQRWTLERLEGGVRVRELP